MKGNGWTRRFVRLAAAASLTTANLIVSRAADPPFRLVDVARESGLVLLNISSGKTKRYLIDSPGNGAAFLDYDRDGDLDVLIVNGSALPRVEAGGDQMVALYQNDGEGRFTASDDTLRMLEAEGRVVLRYVPSTEGSPYQPNPNGSANHIAGISNAAGNVVGIMPHPERVADPRLGEPDGRGFFASIAAWQSTTSTLKVPSR